MTPNCELEKERDPHVTDCHNGIQIMMINIDTVLEDDEN